ncbi:hypothetical protein H696_01474 [Fonticula alba]|uniref:Uncharacterized protein n=1 Tax=Fonticula alba TaxID=691883 RepID=A0A058ZDM8_FONAL|nr:hypothetical protein H696_01474 [Fonticula alba]KCV72066.1 hypothetical protein H696_01474 [Fonticula alba]|eukprot:XP_009493644.1 hypothetical protein H696_01474 [Fonticula alba]
MSQRYISRDGHLSGEVPLHRQIRQFFITLLAFIQLFFLSLNPFRVADGSTGSSGAAPAGRTAGSGAGAPHRPTTGRRRYGVPPPPPSGCAGGSCMIPPGPP